MTLAIAVQSARVNPSATSKPSGIRFTSMNSGVAPVGLSMTFKRKGRPLESKRVLYCGIGSARALACRVPRPRGTHRRRTHCQCARPRRPARAPVGTGEGACAPLHRPFVAPRVDDDGVSLNGTPIFPETGHFLGKNSPNARKMSFPPRKGSIPARKMTIPPRKIESHVRKVDTAPRKIAIPARKVAS